MNNRLNGIENIIKAGIFDETWYATQYPDVRASGLSPAEHFVKYGARLRRKPNAAYDVENLNFSMLTGSTDLPMPVRSPDSLSDIQSAEVETEVHLPKSAKSGLDKILDEIAPDSLPLKEMEKIGEAAEIDEANKAAEIYAGRFSVEELKLKLWGGFSRYAVDCLEEIKNDFRRDSKDRAEAAYCLMQWFYVAENYSRAYENVLIYGMLCNAFLDKQFVIGSVLCLIKLDRLREANELLDAALDDRTKSAIYLSDYLFLKAGIVRLLEPGEQGERTQLEIMADAFKSMGLAPVERFYPGSKFYFGNLTAIASAKTTAQPQKVSIIIPAFNAASSISYVIRSLQAQTWCNLEIIVVDDCSTDNTCDVVSEIMPFDNRIKLVRKTVNEGAYPARNSGLEHVTGDLVMVHDSDDWSHPQKIEIQIRAMNNAPGAVAAMSNWIRVDDQFMPTVHSRPRHTIKSLSFPSLLFKREVVDQIGPWQAVRVSGDAEFKTRIERRYGANAIVKLSKVLSISLSRSGSLTQNSATHINTLHFGVRWQYLGLYDYFHARQLRNDLNCEKCIAVSSAVIGNRSKRTDTVASLDCVFISDFVSDLAIIDYVAAACRTGASVGIYHWRNFEEDFSAPLSGKLYDACLRFGISLLTCSDIVAAKCVIFGDLKIFRYRQDRFPSIKASEVIALVKEPHADSSSTLFSHQQLIHIRATAKVLFGREIRFAANCAPLHSRLQEMGMEKDSLTEPLPPAIDEETWCARQIAWRALRKTEVEIGFPDNAPISEVLDVHGVNAGRTPRARSVELVCRRIDRGDLAGDASMEAMRELDFYVCFPQGGPYEAFCSGILEAMALGIPVILPQEMKSIFGPAAIYARAGAVEKTVQAVWKDESRYLKAARAGRDYVRSHFNTDKFAERFKRLMISHAAQERSGAVSKGLLA